MDVAGTIEEIPIIVDRLRETYFSGKTLPYEWRLKALQQVKKMLTEGREEIIEALKGDLRSIDLIADAEVSTTMKELEITLENLKEWMKPEKRSLPLLQKPGSGYIVKEPYGVVLIISPWNYPISLLFKPMIGAIAAGNTVVLKPSEVSANCSNVISKLVSRYLDPSCVRVVEGAVDVSTKLLKQQWDYIFYTGGGFVGKIVMRAAAEHLTPLTLELGGKSPVFIDKHANLNVAAKRLIWGKFTVNAGQTCVAPDYILVTQDMEKPLLEKLKETLQKFYPEGTATTPDYSRIINKGHVQRLSKLIEEGCDIYYGGDINPDDHYISPTILTNVDMGAPVMQEEIFGPILPVIPVKDVEEAVRFVKSKPKPLALYVFSNDKSTQQKFVDTTSSGGVSINETIMHVACPSLPFGGVGPSGFGAYNGEQTFDTFTHRKSVLNRATWLDPDVRYPPYTPAKIKQLLMANSLKLPLKWIYYLLFASAVPAAYFGYKYVQSNL